MAAIHRDLVKLNKTVPVALSAQSAAADNSACGVRPTQNIEYLAGSPSAELQPFLCLFSANKT